MRRLILVLTMLVLISGANAANYQGIQTNAATDLSTSSATFHGTVLTNQDTEVWFVYGTASGTYAYTSGKQSSSGDFGGRQKGFPLVAGQTYYCRAACAQGYGDEVSFTLPEVTTRATTTYGKAGLELLQHSEEDKGYTALNDNGAVPTSEGKDIFSAFYDAIAAPYVALFGSLFFAIVIGGIFMNLASKGGSLFVPALLSIAGGSMLWGLLPPEAAVLGQSILIFGISGFIFWLFTDRK